MCIWTYIRLKKLISDLYISFIHSQTFNEYPLCVQSHIKFNKQLEDRSLSSQILLFMILNLWRSPRLCENFWSYNYFIFPILTLTVSFLFIISNKTDYQKVSAKTESFRFNINWRWWHPTPVLLPGKSHGRRSLVGCSPWGCEESDMTEKLHFHFSLSCTGEGNGNPLQYACLENPRDGGGLVGCHLWGRTESDTTEASYQQQSINTCAM